MTSNPFQRCGSKVWWNQELAAHYPPDLGNRIGTGSPSSHKSQDSGFSDSEISAPSRATVSSKYRKNEIIKENVQFLQEEKNRQKLMVAEVQANNILKGDDVNVTPKKNLTENIKEKYTQKENIITQLTDSRFKVGKKQKLHERNSACWRSLPRSRNNNFVNQYAKLVPHSNLTNKRYDVDLSISEQRLSEIEETDNYSLPTICLRKDLNDNIAKDSSDKYCAKNDRLLSSGSIIQDITTKEEDYATIENITSEKKQSTFAFNSLDLSNCQNNDDHSNLSFTHNAELTNYNEEDSSNFITEITRSNSFTFYNERHNTYDATESALGPFRKLTVLPFTSTPKKVTVPEPKVNGQNKKRLNGSHSLDENPHILSVQFWLKEIELLYEPECMTTLQSKSIANDLARQVLHSAELLTSPVHEIKRKSKIIYDKFENLLLSLESNEKNNLNAYVRDVTDNVTDIALKYTTKFQANNFSSANVVEYNVSEILSVIETLEHIQSSHQGDKAVQILMKDVKLMFAKVEERILFIEIQSLINLLEDTISDLMLRSILSGLTSLAVQYKEVSDLIAEAAGPRSLLILCIECKASTIRVMALRTLATICSSTAVIRQLEQVGVTEILADILKDNKRPEPELSEATTLLVQITAPWVCDSNSIQFLSKSIDTFIESLTNFLEETKCCQNLLLCTAALANFSQTNINITEYLIKYQTIGKLLKAVRSRGPKASVFLKEQTATLLANLSDVPESKNYLAENNVGIALLCFLQIYPLDIYDDAKSAAALRLQQKSAVALSKLCSDAYVAQQVVELGGVNRLIQLCKDGKERNYSDTVLVACLAALRKIVANCGQDIMDQYDVMELVQPRLLESFLAYSSQNESYV